MPRKRRLNEIAATDAAEGGVATMPPPPEGAAERVEAEEDGPITAGVDVPDSGGLRAEARAKEIVEGINARAQEETSAFAPSDEVEEQEVSREESTPEHTYDVDEHGNVSGVRPVPAPTSPSTNGKPKRIQIALKHGPKFVPERCEFCEGKCPPHPARLILKRPLGNTEMEICAKCDEVFTNFLALLGDGETTLEVVGPDGSRQTDMLNDLEAAVPDGDEDHDGPPTSEVAERIRRIALELPDRPYDQGAAAFCEGIAVEDNPYAAETGPLNQDRRTRWDDGWISAKVDALRAAGETEEADQLAAAAKEDLQAAVQSLASDAPGSSDEEVEEETEPTTPEGRIAELAAVVADEASVDG